MNLITNVQPTDKIGNYGTLVKLIAGYDTSFDEAAEMVAAHTKGDVLMMMPTDEKSIVLYEHTHGSTKELMFGEFDAYDFEDSVFELYYQSHADEYKDWIVSYAARDSELFTPERLENTLHSRDLFDNALGYLYNRVEKSLGNAVLDDLDEDFREFSVYYQGEGNTTDTCPIIALRELPESWQHEKDTKRINEALEFYDYWHRKIHSKEDVDYLPTQLDEIAMSLENLAEHFRVKERID